MHHLQVLILIMGSTNNSPLRTPRSATYVGTGFYSGDVFVWTPTETSSKVLCFGSHYQRCNTPSGDVRGAKLLLLCE
jgi:hypothetical protein